MKKEFERRDFLFEVRAEQDDSGSILTGRPIVYNSKTDLGCFDEMIEQGALNETDMTDVRFLVNHDMSKIPLARSRRNNGNSTMFLQPDMEGLAIRVTLDTENNPEAAALYSAVKRGDISGMSFGFRVKDEEWIDVESDHPTRIIKSISKVIEVSACTFPAYDSSEIQARSKETLESVRSALESERQRKAAEVETSALEMARLRAKIKLL